MEREEQSEDKPKTRPDADDPEAQAPETGPEAEAPPVEAEAEAGPPAVEAEETAEEAVDEPSDAMPAPQPGGWGRHALTAAVSAGVLLFALAFFMAGFAARTMLDEDDGGSGGSGNADSGSVNAAAADDPSWGPDDAAVVIEEYADFQCPFCGRFSDETLPKIRQQYGDQVRFVYRDFPLTSIHENAQKAAEAGQCAQDQGLFWEYHDLLFANQDKLTVPDLKSFAQQAGLETAEFNDCLDSGKNARDVLLDMQDGQRAGVSGTPAFLINGLLLSGAQPFEQFQLAIDQALASVE